MTWLYTLCKCDPASLSVFFLVMLHHVKSLFFVTLTPPLAAYHGIDLVNIWSKIASVPLREIMGPLYYTVDVISQGHQYPETNAEI